MRPMWLLGYMISKQTRVHVMLLILPELILTSGWDLAQSYNNINSTALLLCLL